MLLTPTSTLRQPVPTYLCEAADSIQQLHVSCGAAAIDPSVATTASARSSGEGC